MTDNMNKKSVARLMPVYLVMGSVGIATSLTDYFLINFYAYEHYDIFPSAFLLFAAIGFWATKVSSLSNGVLAGGLMGIVMTGTRGFLMPLLGMPLPEVDAGKTLFFIIIAAIFGLFLGLVGGLPIWVKRTMRWRWHHATLLTLLVYGALAMGLRSIYDPPSKVVFPMEETTLNGKVMDALKVFEIEAPDDSDLAQYRKVLVVGDQVYGFIENPINIRILRTVANDDAVHIKAHVIKQGRLIHIISLTPIDRAEVRLDSIRNQSPRAVDITGTNLCPCGLKLGALKSNCSLGHRHRLVTSDKLYSYLLDEKGRALFTSEGSQHNYHFAKIRVSGKLYGDFFLKVNSMVRVD